MGICGLPLFALQCLQELSLAEGARSARDSVDDGPTCELMGLIASWGSTPGSEERSFSRTCFANQQTIM